MTFGRQALAGAVLIAAAMVGAATLVMEPRPLPTVPGSRPDRGLGAAPSATTPWAPPPAQSLTAFAERPLFEPGRRLVSATRPTGGQRVDDEPPRLLGVVRGETGARALLVAGGGRPVSVREDEAVGGWRLATVRSDGVSLVRGEQSLNLPLRPDDRSGSQASSAVPAAAVAAARRAGGSAGLDGASLIDDGS